MSAAPPPLRIGIAGYGVMGKAHSYGYRVAPMLRRLPVTPMITVMSGRDAAAVAAAASAYGIPVTVTDWRELIGRDDVDMVDICTPPGTHAQIAAAAAAAGKAVLCEKPLALTYAEAAGALTAVTRAGVHNAVGFNYRRLPAIALMRRMIADLGSHLIDMALCMAGPVDSVCAQAVTFIGDRPSGSGSGTTKVTVDDAASALLRFESGARGTMEVARAAVRRPCDFTVEVNGSRGTLLFSYARLNELWYGGADDDIRLYGMRRIRAEHPSHPYAAQWWPIGQGVGYGSSFANQTADLLEGWPDAPWSPGFRDGAAVQAVCDAMETSAASGRWVSVSEVLASPL